MIVSQTFSPETEVSAARQTPQSRHTNLRALCLRLHRALFKTRIRKKCPRPLKFLRERLRKQQLI
jgi:hypothetical protein